jgi:hypothetical protein
MRIVRWLVLSIAVFALVYQIRYSLATIEASQTFLFVPFRLKPFTNVIDSVTMAAKQGEVSEGIGIRRGDELIAINGRPFVGQAVLSQELRRARQYLDSINILPPIQANEAILRWPFSVTVRSGAGERTTPVYFANCTCGNLNVRQVVWYSLLPSAFCVLIGLVVVVKGPRSPETWAFLGLMLCLSQVQVAPFLFGDWSLAAGPMEWRDWFRVPALVYQSFFSLSWPALLLLYASYSFSPLNNRTTKWAAAAITAVCLFKTGLILGWAESFRSVAPVHAAAGPILSWVPTGAFVVTAIVASRLPRFWAVMCATLAALAIAALYWPTTPYAIVTYPGTLKAGVETMQPLHLFRTPEVIGTTLVFLTFCVAVAACWRGRKAVQFVGMLLLFIPLLYRAVSTVWGVWWMPLIPSFALASLYGGGLLSTWLMLRGAKVIALHVRRS